MKFDSRITFPYPVLGLRDDILGEPEFDYDIQEDGQRYIVEIRKIDLHNPSIKSYIGTRQAKYVCEIDCSRTFYRICVDNYAPVFRLIIPKKDVSGEVNIYLTVTASKNIYGYRNSLANKDYAPYNFDLEPGDILAYIGGLSIQTDIMAEEYKAVGSFLHFKGEDVSGISYNLTGADIEIVLPLSMFDTYVDHLKGHKYRPVIIASIIKEAITYALTQYNSHKDARWARILYSADALKDYDFEDCLDITTAIEMSNDLLKQPYCELFDSLVQLDLDDENQI